VKLSKLPAKSLRTPASLKLRAMSSLAESLQRQDLVSVTRFVCGNPRSANQTCNTFRPHWQKPPLACRLFANAAHLRLTPMRYFEREGRIVAS
jgi:hypothetical protein